MPTCLVYTRGPALPSSFHAHGILAASRRHYHGFSRAKTRRMALSTAVPAAMKKPQVPDHAANRNHTLTVLHKTRSLLPRILPPEVHALVDAESVDFWNDLLARAHDRMSLSQIARHDDVRVVVYGCDELSGAQELVTALLQDPFAAESQKERLTRRWESVPKDNESIILQSGVPAAEDPENIVHVSSAWFQQFGPPLELFEIVPRQLLSLPSPSLQSLLRADIPVIVCNPASTTLSTIISSPALLSLPFVHPHAILVVTSASSSAALAEHIKSSSDSDVVPLFIDPGRALAALHTLSLAPSSSTAVQKYQDDFAGSNISALSEAISQTLSSYGPPSTVAAALHTETARALIRGSLNACHTVLTRAEHEADAVSAGISELRCQMEEAEARAGKEVFGIAGARPDEGDEIQKAITSSRRDMKAVMDALVWWKLPLKVDDLREIVGTAADRAWCTDLEHKLIFHAGRLASLQRSFTDSSMALLARSPPPSPFHSTVLHNELSQLAATPGYPLAVSELTQPLHLRRLQLRFPTARLHATAQRAVLGMGGSVFSGLGVAWAGWVGQLGLLDVGMQIETVVGIGMLGAVAGVRWAVGRFERAKRRWWQDWDRVGEGLGRDLRATLDRTMGERVVVMPQKACSGLEHLVTKRRDEIADLRDEVTALENELGPP